VRYCPVRRETVHRRARACSVASGVRRLRRGSAGRRAVSAGLRAEVQA
jgi:hypothetical protein